MRQRLLFAIFSVLLLTLFTAPLFAQDDALAEMSLAYDVQIPALMAEHGIPGATITAFNRDGIVFSAAYGVADIESESPVTLETPFPVWSISKLLTAWAVLDLAEQGRIDLDAPISTYISRWAFPTTRFDTDLITPRRLLSHMAGLSVEGYDTFSPDDPLPTLEGLLSGEGADAVRVMGPAGMRFSYSGGGFQLLQLAIEEITETPFADYMQDTVFQPHAMDHSSFVWTQELGAVTGYTRSGAPADRPVHADLAAGGLYTSADDLATFLSTLLLGRESEIEHALSADSADQLFAPADGTDGEYGLGVFLRHDNNDDLIAWHDGLGPEAKAVFYLRPYSGADGLLILTNAVQGDRLFEPALCIWAAYAQADFEECG